MMIKLAISAFAFSLLARTAAFEPINVPAATTTESDISPVMEAPSMLADLAISNVMFPSLSFTPSDLGVTGNCCDTAATDQVISEIYQDSQFRYYHMIGLYFTIK